MLYVNATSMNRQALSHPNNSQTEYTYDGWGNQTGLRYKLSGSLDGIKVLDSHPIQITSTNHLSHQEVQTITIYSPAKTPLSIIFSLLVSKIRPLWPDFRFYIQRKREKTTISPSITPWGRFSFFDISIWAFFFLLPGCVCKDKGRGGRKYFTILSRIAGWESMDVFASPTR